MTRVGRLLAVRGACCLAIGSFAGSVVAQKVVWTVQASEPDSLFGISLDVCADCSGDGFPDVLVGAPRHGWPDPGAAFMHSGQNGALVLNWLNPPSSGIQGMGHPAVFVGDTNADGAQDWGVAQDQVYSSPSDGRLEIVSGLDASTLVVLEGSGINEQFAAAVDDVGDIDGDGRSDYVVGTPEYWLPGASSSGRVQVYSGATADVIREHVGAPQSQLGSHVLGVGDVDGDGIPDYAAASWQPGSPASDSLVMFSGASGQALWALSEAAIGNPYELGHAGDFDEDGARDLAVYGYELDLAVISGATGATLRLLEEEDSELDGRAGGGDVDGDGLPDVWASVWDGNTASLQALSLASGRSLLGIQYGPGESLWSAEFLGDVDGDGASESVIGFATGNLGKVRAYAGEPGIQSSTYGPSPDARYGQALAPAGDIDGDGFGELLVGAPHEDWIGQMMGAVHVVSGRTGRDLFVVRGTDDGEQFGHAVVSLGDLDDDGVPDFAAGAPQGVDHPGLVRTLSGADGAVLRTWFGPSVNSSFGYALASAGDLDGDGKNDLLVGAPNHSTTFFNAGHAQIFSTSSGDLLLEPLQDQLGPDHQFGESVAGLGDVDGDGVPDYAVGAPGPGASGGKGYVRVLSGAEAETIIHATSGSSLIPGEGYGESVVNVGDFDGDDVNDLAIGAPGFTSPASVCFPEVGFAQTGRAVVISGASGATIRGFTGDPDCFIFASFCTCFPVGLGTAISAAGDQDCDGVPDLLLGSGARPPQVRSGATGALLEEFPDLGGPFGSAAANAGDWNGDGRDDIAFADAGWNSGGANRGAVKVYTLNPRFVRPERYCVAKKSSLGCKPSISYSGSPQLSGNCDDFYVRANDVIGQTSGGLLWGTAPNSLAGPAAPWSGSGFKAKKPSPYGGLYCVADPEVLGRQASGGTTGQCDGDFAFHFSQALLNARGLQAGQTLYAQWWYSDPLHPDGTGIGHTDALEITLIP